MRGMGRPSANRQMYTIITNCVCVCVRACMVCVCVRACMVCVWCVGVGVWYVCVCVCVKISGYVVISIKPVMLKSMIDLITDTKCSIQKLV